MRKYNKSGKGVFEEYDRKLDKKRKKYGKKRTLSFEVDRDESKGGSSSASACGE